MGLGNNRDYTTTHRRALRNLKLHAEIMGRLEAVGVERLEASRIALEIMRCAECRTLGRHCSAHGAIVRGQALADSPDGGAASNQKENS